MSSVCVCVTVPGPGHAKLILSLCWPSSSQNGRELVKWRRRLLFVKKRKTQKFTLVTTRSRSPSLWSRRNERFTAIDGRLLFHCDSRPVVSSPLLFDFSWNNKATSNFWRGEENHSTNPQQRQSTLCCPDLWGGYNEQQEKKYFFVFPEKMWSRSREPGTETTIQGSAGYLLHDFSILFHLHFYDILFKPLPRLIVSGALFFFK